MPLGALPGPCSPKVCRRVPLQIPLRLTSVYKCWRNSFSTDSHKRSRLSSPLFASSIIFLAIRSLIRLPWSPSPRVAMFAKPKVAGQARAIETSAPVSPHEIMVKQGRSIPVEYWAPSVLRERGRPPPPSRSARSNLRGGQSERIVPDRGHDDVVVGQNISPDSHEGFTFDVLVLGAEGHAAIISLVDILPEARRYFG